MASARRLLFCSGSGSGGKLGSSSPGSLLFAAVTSLAETGISSCSCGNAHTVAVSSCGAIFTFGSNELRQLGHSPTAREVCRPQEVLLPERVVSAAAGAAFTLAVTESGAVWGWGDNQYGQVGVGSRDRVVACPKLLGGLPKVARVAAGFTHALALSEDGEVFAWGSNLVGQTGLEPDRSSVASWFGSPLHRSPRLLRELARTSSAVHVGAGAHHSIVATSSAGCFGFGDNQLAQLAPLKPSRVHQPEQMAGTQMFQRVACGHVASAALDGSGQLWMWGSDLSRRGQLPGAPLMPQSTAAQCADAPPLRSVALGFAAAAGVSERGDLVTWGWSGNEMEGATALDRAHGIEPGGNQLGHGEPGNVYRPRRVERVLLPQASDASRALEYDVTGVQDGEAWGAVEVACGFDHMAAVVEVPEQAVLAALSA